MLLEQIPRYKSKLAEIVLFFLSQNNLYCWHLPYKSFIS